MSTVCLVAFGCEDLNRPDQIWEVREWTDGGGMANFWKLFGSCRQAWSRTVLSRLMYLCTTAD